jgi:hypothetical protein
MKYRPHRRFIDESIALVVEVDGRAGLIEHLRRDLAEWPTIRGFHEQHLHIDPYGGDDDRIGWKNVSIVTLDGYGVMGFCENWNGK